MRLRRRAVFVVAAVAAAVADGNSALGAPPPRVATQLMEDEQDAAVSRAARQGRDAIGE